MRDRQQNFAIQQNDLDTQDSLDATLDHALSSYTPAHPRLGLEARVRARIDSAAGSAHSRERIPMLWIWVSATALAALLLVGLTLRPHARPAPANLAAIPSGPSIPTIQISGRLAAKVLAHPPSKLPSRRTQPPRLNPRQPSQQQLIAQLLANGPEAIASLARDDDKLNKPVQPLPDDPLVIEPIKITPIDDNPAEPGGRF